MAAAGDFGWTLVTTTPTTFSSSNSSCLRVASLRGAAMKPGHSFELSATSSSLRFSIFTLRVTSLPSRRTTNSAVSPTVRSPTSRTSWSTERTSWPFSLITKSPACIPAFWAGEPMKIWDAKAPTRRPTPKASLYSLVMSTKDTPIQPYVTFPVWMNESIAFFTLLMGIAKPNPWDPPDWDAIQVLIPITSP